MKDLDFEIIFKESDRHSRELYFLNCFFGYTLPEENLEGVVKVLRVENNDTLLCTFYYRTTGSNTTDLSIRRGMLITADQCKYLSSIPLHEGFHVENLAQAGDVCYVQRIPVRSAKKGLTVDQLTGRHAFPSSEDLFAFLLDVRSRTKQNNPWYVSTDGRTYCCGYYVEGGPAYEGVDSYDGDEEEEEEEND